MTIIRVYLEQIRAVQAPVTFLSAGVLVLVLYYVLTTTSLALEQQANEWATISSRGGSSVQLILIHGITVLVQCVLGFALSLPIARGMLFLLRRVGPLANLAIGPTVHIEAPAETWNYAAIAAVFAAVALLLPAIPAARKTIILLQQNVAPAAAQAGLVALFPRFRPAHPGRGPAGPLRPTWQPANRNVHRPEHAGRHDSSGSPAGADRRRATLVAALSAADAPDWLDSRPVPRAGRTAGFWGISRNPGHYAQLVLLLLGAFGLGAMASTLSATRDSAAWQQAQFDTGGAVRVELAEMADAEETDWYSLSGVTAASPVFRGVTNNLQRIDSYELIAIDVETLNQVTTLEPEIVEALRVDDRDLGGIPLPEEMTGISLWAVHQVPHEDAALTLWALLGDRWGHRLALELEGDPLVKDEWVQWHAELPANGGRPPWRLLAVALSSERGTPGITQGAVTIDDVEILLTDGTTTAVTDMESDEHTWTPPEDTDTLSYTEVTEETTLTHSGGRAITLDYSSLESSRFGGATAFAAWVNRKESGMAPVFVERRWAEQRGLKVGDPLRVEVTLPAPYDIRGQRVFCEIVGLLDGFPTLVDTPTTFVIGSLQQLLPAINAGALDWPLEPNEVWLATDSFQAPAGLLSELEDPRLEVAAVHTAYQEREALRREPLPNAFAGILFGGFWVALILSLVGLGFYLALTVRGRVVSFSVLRALGWTGKDVWQLLVIEQLALTLPAVVVGLLLGIGLASVVRDLIPVVAGATLVVPAGELLIMLAGLLVGLAVLLVGTGYWLQKRQLARTLRLGGE